DRNSVSVEWEKPLERAQKFPITESVLREQLSRLGDTPYELRDLTTDIAGDPMVPKSVLNDLRRQAVEKLIDARRRGDAHAIANPNALDSLRASAIGETETNDAANLYVLARTLDQLDAVLACESDLRPTFVYCD